MMKTFSTSLRLLSISAIALAISALFAPIALADVNDGPHADGSGGVRGLLGGAATGAPSANDGTSANISFEYFPNGAIKRIRMHCSHGTVPRIDSEGGVVRQSCQRVADQPV